MPTRLQRERQSGSGRDRSKERRRPRNHGTRRPPRAGSVRRRFRCDPECQCRRRTGRLCGAARRSVGQRPPRPVHDARKTAVGQRPKYRSDSERHRRSVARTDSRRTGRSDRRPHRQKRSQEIAVLRRSGESRAAGRNGNYLERLRQRFGRRQGQRLLCATEYQGNGRCRQTGRNRGRRRCRLCGQSARRVRTADRRIGQNARKQDAAAVRRAGYSRIEQSPLRRRCA